jgi:arylsulfatase
MIDLGLIDPQNAPLPPRVQPDRSWEDNPHATWDAQAMAVHAAMVDRMDQGIGRIMEALDRRGMRENTIILFLSDNGASPEIPGQPGFDRPSHTRDGRAITYTTSKEMLPGPETTFAGIGPMWANAVNTPLRRWKAETFEGGICTPMIAHWPSGLGVEGGTITDQQGHVIDLMATCVELAGASYPETFAGRSIALTAGRSLVPILQGNRRQGHDALFWEHFGARAVRRGDWKLVAPRGQPWQLYDVGKDRTETVDRAADRPELVAELAAIFDSWAARDLVEPAPD